MEDDVKNYDIPDFEPDDDTEDMTGISIYDPHSVIKDIIPDLSDLPEFPSKIDDNDKSS